MVRMGDAIAARRRTAGAAASLAERVSRGGRSYEDWMRDLARLTDDATNYRAAEVRLDDLLGLIEDASAPADARGEGPTDESHVTP